MPSNTTSPSSQVYAGTCDFSTFCKTYFDSARKSAEYQWTKQVTGNNALKNYGYGSLLQDIAATDALEDAYCHYDPNNDSHATVETYLKTIIHNKMVDLIEEESANHFKRVTYKEPNPLVSKSESSSNPLSSLISLEGETGEIDRMKLYDGLVKAIQKFKGIDQTIIWSWVSNRSHEYIEAALDELGWGDTEANRRLISVRCNRALEKLREEGKTLLYRLKLESSMDTMLHCRNDVHMGFMVRSESTFREPISAKAVDPEQTLRKERVKRITKNINFREFKKRLIAKLMGKEE